MCQPFYDTLNVVATGDQFKSQLSSESGHEFTQSFDTSSLVKYFCEPHKAAGMKGAVVVEEP